MKIDFIIPSYCSKDLTSLAVRSFEKHKNQHDFNYIVVENSTDTSYRGHIKALSPNVIWVQNPETPNISQNGNIASVANAMAVEKGLEYVNTEYVFICHNDVVACHENWLDFLVDKMKKHNLAAASYVLDNGRINALHISGILVKTEVAKAVSMHPVYEDGKQLLDVGDSITQYCRDNDLDYFFCRNTHNDEAHVDLCEDVYKELAYVDRALDDDGNVIFLHLGRGSVKTLGTYWKANRTTLDGWVEFVEKNILA